MANYIFLNQNTTKKGMGYPIFISLETRNNEGNHGVANSIMLEFEYSKENLRLHFLFLLSQNTMIKNEVVNFIFLEST